MNRILAIYELQGPWSTADDTPQMMQLSDFRLWLFRDSPSAASPGSTILPVLPFYQSKVVEKSTAVWELLENAE